MDVSKVGPIEKLTRQDADAHDYQKAVWYDVEHGRLVATNGHALVIAAVEPEPEDVTGFVTVAAIRYARTHVYTNKFKCLADSFVFADLTRMARPLGEFPDYAAIIPVVTGAPTITFNPELLAQIVGAFPKQEVGKKSGQPGSISLWVQRDEADKPSPIIVKAHYDGGLAVMMPISGMDPVKWNTHLPSGKKAGNE